MIRGSKRSLGGDTKTIMSKIHNRFDIEVVDAKTGEVKQRAKAENVICDQVWSYYTGGWSSCIAYGSGSGTPSSSDTDLFTRVGTVKLGDATWDHNHIAEGYISFTKSASLSETVAVGITLTEIGLTTDSSKSYKLCTHAMLTDMNGNAISILKTDTDIINLYATVFFHWDLSGYNGVELIPRSTVPPTGGMTGYISFSKGKHSGFSPSTYTYINAPFDSSTRTFTITCPRIPVSDVNVGGFKYAKYGPFIVEIEGPHRVVGESVGTGDGVTVDFATKIDFPSNATVYVDGVPASGVTVSEEPLSYNDLGQYFWRLDLASTVEHLIPCEGSVPTNTSSMSTESLYYNPLYELGIDSHAYNSMSYIKASNDLVNWETVYDYTNNINKSISEYKNYKFWKTQYRSVPYSTSYWRYLTCNSINGKNIHFETAPSSGSVITIDYDTPMVPKDENHVFDFNFKVQIAPYVAE